MPNIFEKQASLIKKKTTGIRPYNFHEKLDEHAKQSEKVNNEIANIESKITQDNSIPEIPSRTFRNDKDEASITSGTAKNDTLLSSAPTPLPTSNSSLNEENKVKPSLSLGNNNITEENNIVKTYLDTSFNLNKEVENSQQNCANLPLNQIKPSSKHRHISRHNLVKTWLESGQETVLSRIVGLQKTITHFLFTKALEASDGTTGQLSALDIASSCNTSIEGARTTIKELIRKNIISKVSFKEGRGGWTRYRLTESIYQTLISNLDKEKPGLNQVNSKQGSSLNSGQTISSHSIYTSKTTSDLIIPDKKELPQEWKDIDYSCLASINFKDCHLQQIFESGKVSPEMVQNSIYELDHDLKSGNHEMRNPLLVLLKQLSGKGEPYTAITPGYQFDELKYEQKRLEELKRRNAELIRIKAEQKELENLHKTSKLDS